MLEFEKMVITKYDMMKVRNIEYYLYHISTEGNKAYYCKASLGSKRFVIELVRQPDFRWYFHVEKNEEMIFDSRLGNVYYPTAEKAHIATINAILEKYERKELAKFCKTKSTKKR
jgi:hypothetical protein